MHRLIALARRLDELIYGRVPAHALATLSQFTMPCAWLICSLCLCAGSYDLVRGRRFDALLWLGMTGLLFSAFWLETTVSGPQLTLKFAAAALAIAFWLLGRSLRQLFEAAPRPGGGL